MRKESIALIIGAVIGLTGGLVLTFLTYINANKAFDMISQKLEDCVTIGEVIEQTGIELSEEQKKSVAEIDANLKVCLSDEYKQSLEKQLKDMDLSNYDIDSIIDITDLQF